MEELHLSSDSEDDIYAKRLKTEPQYDDSGELYENPHNGHYNGREDELNVEELEDSASDTHVPEHEKYYENSESAHDPIEEEEEEEEEDEEPFINIIESKQSVKHDIKQQRVFQANATPVVHHSNYTKSHQLNQVHQHLASSSTPVAASTPNAAVNDGEPVKRKRGRPRLNKAKVENVEKRPRGRPKKNPDFLNATDPLPRTKIDKKNKVDPNASAGGEYVNFGGFLSMGHSLFGDRLSNERLNATAPAAPKKRGRPRKDSILITPSMMQAYMNANKAANESDEMMPNPIEPECIVHHANIEGHEAALVSPNPNQSVRFATEHEEIRTGNVSKFNHNSANSIDMRSILLPKKRGRKKKVPLDANPELLNIAPKPLEPSVMQPIDVSVPVKKKRGRPKGFKPPPRDPNKKNQKRVKTLTMKSVAAQAMRAGLYHQTNGAAHTNGLLNQYKIETNDIKSHGKIPLTNGAAMQSNSKRLMAINDVDSSPAFLQSCNTLLNERNQVLLTSLQEDKNEIQTLKAKIIDLSKEKRTAQLGSHRTEDQFYEAFNLLRLSTKFYKYSIERFNLPLPTVDEIAQWIKSISFARGILRTSMGIMKASGLLLAEHERATLLQITPVFTREIYEYDERLDIVYRPQKQMCVVTAQGLYADWSHVIFFDTECDRESLDNIIILLHRIGFSVVACTMEFKEKDMPLYKSACKDRGRSYIPHPVTSAEINCFFFIEDLFTVLRRRFLQTGFVTPFGKVNERSIRNLLQAQVVELDIIELGALSPNDWFLAKELFSKGIGQLLLNMDNDDEETKATGEFVRLMADLYEMSTLRRDHKVGFGKNLSAQMRLVDDVKNVMYRLRCVGHKEMEGFQNGIIMNLDSLKHLHATCQRNYKIDSVSTQVIKRNFFNMQMSDMRIGGDKEWSPLEYIDIINRRFVGQDKRLPPVYRPSPCVVRINPAESETENVGRLTAWIHNVYNNASRDKMSIACVSRHLERMEYVYSAYRPDLEDIEGFLKQIADKLDDIPFDLARLYARHRQLVRISYFNTLHDFV